MSLSTKMYTYEVISLSLATARSNVAEGLASKINTLSVITLNNGTLSVKLNSNSNDSIDLSESTIIQNIPINELYWSNSAQAGKIAYIFVVWAD